MVTAEAAFWDASALVPLFVTQPTTSAVRKHLARYLPVVWWGTVSEVHSAVWRVVRAGVMEEAQALQAIDSARWLQTAWQEIRPDDAVRDTSCELLRRYPLRAADSFQLAAAMVWCRHRPAGRSFLCADRRLSGAARDAGFSVIEF